MGRPKGSKNKVGHNAGGNRKGKDFIKKAGKNKHKNPWSLNNKKPKPKLFQKIDVHHPLCEDNISKSQDDIQYVIHHASMPKSRDLPECGSILNDDTIDYTKRDDNIEDDDIYSRRTYIPPELSPLGIYLNNMKKNILKCSILKEQQIISPKSSPISYLAGNPSPNKFYQNVLIYNYDPKSQYKGFGIEYKCIHCNGTNLRYLGKRYRPAFSGGSIHWIFYDRYQCESNCCTGGHGKNRCFGTIDSKFVKQLPSPISCDFKYVFPPSGPGIELDMVRSMSMFTDKHVLFSAFANCVNDLQWQRYYKQCNSYYYLLNEWIER